MVKRIKILAESKLLCKTKSPDIKPLAWSRMSRWLLITFTSQKIAIKIVIILQTKHFLCVDMRGEWKRGTENIGMRYNDGYKHQRNIYVNVSVCVCICVSVLSVCVCAFV